MIVHCFECVKRMLAGQDNMMIIQARICGCDCAMTYCLKCGDDLINHKLFTKLRMFKCFICRGNVEQILDVDIPDIKQQIKTYICKKCTPGYIEDLREKIRQIE